MEAVRQLKTQDLLQYIKKLICENLPSSTYTIEHIAKKLYMSNRKLQRQLKLADTCYQQLLQQCRLRLVQQYLKEGRFSITDIGLYVKYFL